MPSAPTKTSTRFNRQPSTIHSDAKGLHPSSAENKENSGYGVPRGVSISQPELPNLRLEALAPQLPPLFSKRKSPRTPASKLSTADLIRNTEDAYNYECQKETPEEQVTWQQGTIPGSSGPSGTMTSTKSTRSARRGNKRARSSSPSVYAHKSPRVEEKDSIDMSGLRSSLHSPQQPASQHEDPGQDLYRDYMGVSFGLKGREGQLPPALPGNIALSPTTPSKTQGSISKMQRSTSCGIVWPASRQKKRRLNPISAEPSKLRERFAKSKPVIMDRDESKELRVDALMGTLQENALKLPSEPAGPSSSSPHPDRVGFATSQAESPDTPTKPLPEIALNPPQAVLEEESYMDTSLDRTSDFERGLVEEESIEQEQQPKEQEQEQEQGQQQPEQPEPKYSSQFENPSSESFGADELFMQALDDCIAAAEASKDLATGEPTIRDVTGEEYRKDSGLGGKPNTYTEPKTVTMLEESFSALPEASREDEVAQAEAAPLPVIDEDDDDDEFGEDFDCDEEMAELAAQYDTQVNPVASLPESEALLADAQALAELTSESLSSFDPDEARATDHAPLEEPQHPPTVPTQPAHATGSADSHVSSVQIPDMADDDDEYGDDDDDLFQQIADGTLILEGSGMAAANQQRNCKQAIKRYLILDVYENDSSDAKHPRARDKTLSVKDEETGLLKVIVLRDSWLQSRCTKGSYVHLIGDFDHLGQCVVDDKNNMIILHPDHLISATVVADSFSCTRRAVLQDRIKATASAQPPQVYGQILHEIFGQALEANDWSAESLRKTIEKILEYWIESLYEIKQSVEMAIDYLMSKMPELQAWASVFVSADARPEGQVRDRNGALSKMNLNKLLEVEEHIWSPMFGLKGNIDATVQVTLQESGQGQPRTLTVPLEFKTGKKDNNEMHRAQTQLYTLLLSDRYDIQVVSGVLYYLETSKTFRVEALRNEIRHMIIQRNELACYVRNKLELPPMIKKPHLCSHCYAQTSCFTYHKLIDGGDGETSALGEKFTKATNHLKPAHQVFFQKWDELLTKEERDAMKFRRELWTMLSDERESLGRCFGGVYVEPNTFVEQAGGSKINRYQYTFKKAKPKPGFTFADSQVSVGEPIVVSDEKGHFALANGYVAKVYANRLVVAVDRKLHERQKSKGFDPVNRQVFNGIMEVATTKADTQADSTGAFEDPPMLFRVDKDEFSNGMATVRNNLIRMMEKDLYRARELRELVVENAAPAFRTNSTAYNLAGGPASQQNLNVDQVRAIEKVMSASDYALVLGMPGTGKTTTIAHIIRALVGQGKSVFLSSYTHTAVDNILLKIKDDGIPILRLGAVAKVHPEVQKFADLAAVPKKTIAELEESYTKSQVVAATCLGVNHPIFNERIFDYCIVDEASQITLPTCLGPIRMAKTFILVGDHYQLPPLVQNKEAQEGGLDISLFKMLSDNQPGSVVNLTHQYRMAADIMLLANTLIYDGRLKCGTPAIASRTLSIPNLEAGLAKHHHSQQAITLPSQQPCPSRSTCWLRQAIAPTSRALFLNTDPLLPASRDIIHRGSARLTNPLEATLTTQLVLTLLSCSIPASSIGIIAFYRSQLTHLRQNTPLGSIAGLEMHTADKFQGTDKEIIIISCVRSNEACNIGDLLKDWRRVNVAITRARSKLLILGSRGTLEGSGNKTLQGLVRVMDDKGWVRDLPADAADDHVFDDGRGGRGLSTATPTTSPKKTPATGPSGSPRRGSPRVRERQVLGESPTKANQLSPGKASAVVPGGAFKMPLKKIDGGMSRAEKALERSGVLRDVANGL